MTVHRTIRYRLHPGRASKHRKLMNMAGACRFVWNHFVRVLRDEYRAYGRCEFTYFSLGPRFTNLRKAMPWLQDLPANNVKYALRPIQTAYERFFKGEGGLPNLKDKYEAYESIPLPTGRFKLRGRSLHVPKIGEMRLCGRNPYPDAKPVKGTIKREGGKWYAYMVFAVQEAAKPKSLSYVSIDRNVGQIADSDGNIHWMPDLKRLERRRKRYWRMMKRRTGPCRKTGRKASNRYVRARTLHQRACARIVHVRMNWVHQVTRRIANKHNVAVLEDLNIKGMTKSAKGTIENPGCNVAQKRGLNKSIMGSAWGPLDRVFGYKMAHVIKVAPQWTSQTCSCCGAIDKNSRRSQSEFVCTSCGFEINADVNAALNILASGTGASGRGGVRAQAPPLKRQSPGLEVIHVN